MTATAAMFTSTRLLPLVDRRDFRKLFVEELGWENPDQPARTITVDGQPYVLTQVAGYKGMRIWHCPELPGRRIQRVLDQALEKDNLERLVIFTSDTEQEWRWPRRAQTGGVNAKLLVHAHKVGEDDPHLVDQLDAITIDFDEDPTLVEVLARMRSAFDVEAEAASVAAARLMARLYSELEASDLSAHDATLLLARLLFLLFGDDSGMWRTNMFREWLATHTTDTTLNTDLTDLFDVLNTDEKLRDLPAGSPLADFRYVNGGLYRDQLYLSELTSSFRTGLLDACDFDWALISPAVFGSMFQVVKDKAARNRGGEHYTTEENILKTINPLFLDELRDRLDRAWDDKTQLTRLHNELGRMRLMDPACGCGNFLIVAYRELRALELQLLKRRRDLDEADGIWARSQTTIDVTDHIKVTLDHFYGIEIEEWPARIAETAMLLVDHLANQAMAEEFGVAPDRLPVRIAPTIVHDSALTQDWKAILPPTKHTYILGNPPFLGKKQRDETQTAEMKTVWGDRYSGEADYVTSWHAKAVDYFSDVPGEWAFVATNSICQGQPVRPVFGAIFDAGWRIKFAHRTFQWTSEATGKATVQCVIVGFTKDRTVRPRLFEYRTAKSHPEELAVDEINAYLVDGPNLLVKDERRALSPQLVGDIRFGSMAADGGNLIVKELDYPTFAADPIAAKYLRPFPGARELIHSAKRWCIWMPELVAEDVRRSPLLRERFEAVRIFRSEEAKDAGVRASANTPHRFNRIQQPTSEYLCIPRHVSENRRYYLAMRFGTDVIASDANFVVSDPDGFFFSLISSSMFITWQRTVGGALESRLRFASTVTWNTLPLPPVDDVTRSAIVLAGEEVLAARAVHPERSLADHYDPNNMDPELVAAHDTLDEVVDRAFGASGRCGTYLERQEILFGRYREMTASVSPRRSN